MGMGAARPLGGEGGASRPRGEGRGVGMGAARPWGGGEGGRPPVGYPIISLVTVRPRSPQHQWSTRLSKSTRTSRWVLGGHLHMRLVLLSLIATFSNYALYNEKYTSRRN